MITEHKMGYSRNGTGRALLPERGRKGRDRSLLHPGALRARWKRRQEKKTLRVMIGMYCRDLHGPQRTLCGSCAGLLDYALGRMEKCPYEEDKPTCVRCPVHCFKPAMRTSIQTVMRHSGPRMLYKHPVLALLHLLRDRKANTPRS